MAAGDIYENGTHGGSANNTHNHYIPESFDLDNVYFTGKVSNTTEDDIANLRTRVLKRERVFFITPTDHPGTTIYNNHQTRENSTYNETINIMPPYFVVYIWKRNE